MAGRTRGAGAVAPIAAAVPGRARAFGRIGGWCAAGNGLCLIQRLGRARAAHGDHAGRDRGAAAQRAPLAVAACVAAGLRGRGGGRPLGPGASGVLAELCGSWYFVCYQSDS